MEIIKLNKKQLENLQPLELDKKIFNTEAQIFKLNEKKQFISELKENNLELNEEILKAQADEKGLGEDVKFYLEFFKYGCPPHGGFGIGIDRLTMLLLNLHIKESMFLFRGPNRLEP